MATEPNSVGTLVSDELIDEGALNHKLAMDRFVDFLEASNEEASSLLRT